MFFFLAAIAVALCWLVPWWFWPRKKPALGDECPRCTTPRSPGWPAAREKHLKCEPQCAACGRIDRLEVHHIRPVHLFPELELSESNLLTLCDGPINCHLAFGHAGDYRAWNPHAIFDAEQLAVSVAKRRYDRKA